MADEYAYTVGVSCELWEDERGAQEFVRLVYRLYCIDRDIGVCHSTSDDWGV